MWRIRSASVCLCLPLLLGHELLPNRQFFFLKGLAPSPVVWTEQLTEQNLLETFTESAGFTFCHIQLLSTYPLQVGNYSLLSRNHVAMVHRRSVSLPDVAAVLLGFKLCLFQPAHEAAPQVTHLVPKRYVDVVTIHLFDERIGETSTWSFRIHDMSCHLLA